MTPTIPQCLTDSPRKRLGALESALMRQRIGDNWTRDRIEWTPEQGWADMKHLPLNNRRA